MESNQNGERIIISANGWAFRIGFLVIVLGFSIGIVMESFENFSSSPILILPAIGWFWYFWFCRRVADCSCNDSKVFFSAWGRLVELFWHDIEKIKLPDLTQGGAFLRIDLKNPTLLGTTVFVNLPFSARNRDKVLRVIQKHKQIG